jgi:hypothetical protein
MSCGVFESTSANQPVLIFKIAIMSVSGIAWKAKRVWLTESFEGSHNALFSCQVGIRALQDLRR